MENLPNCPECGSEYTYEDGELYICPECAHEWSKDATLTNTELIVKDSNGNILHDGDSVTVIKDLKVKGSSSVVKVGTKIKGIKLVDAADDHNIQCKIPGIGALNVTPKYVKKV
jgi:protein PhnA